MTNWNIPQADSKVYKEVFEVIVPESIEKFKSKAPDYDDTFMLLGAKGQFSDINRKFWKLYKAVWLGRKLEGEQPEEIAMDFIGHCLLLIYCLRKGING